VLLDLLDLFTLSLPDGLGPGNVTKPLIRNVDQLPPAHTVGLTIYPNDMVMVGASMAHFISFLIFGGYSLLHSPHKCQGLFVIVFGYREQAMNFLSSGPGLNIRINPNIQVPHLTFSVAFIIVPSLL